MSSSENEYHINYASRDEAMAMALEQAIRDLSETDALIAYVAFIPDLEDFCRCEFRLEAPHGWALRCRVLRADEREAGEQIDDARTREVARAGNLLTAIRLYRTRYEVGLAEGKAGVERLLGESI